VHLYKLAAGAVWDLEATISATGTMQLVLTELDRRGHLVQHLVQDCLQLQAAQLGQLLVHTPAFMIYTWRMSSKSFPVAWTASTSGAVQ